MNGWLLTALLVMGALQAQGVRLTSRWSADTVKVGEPVTLRLEVDQVPGVIPHFPELTLSSPGASLLQTNREPLAVEYVISFWELWQMVLPGIPVRIVLPDGSEQQLLTDSLFVLVASVLTGQERDIREIKSMVPVRLINPQSVWIRVGAALLLLAAMALIWRTRRMQTRVQSRTARLRPAEIALDALRGLGAADYRSDEADAFYLQLSQVLRQYLESRFVFRALEMTTTEILALLPARLDHPDTILRIGEVLQQSDLAKFAGLPLSANQWRDDVKRARQIVQSTRTAIGV